MTFKEWEGRAFDRFSGTITNPRFSGPFVKHLLADWKAERGKFIMQAKILVAQIKQLELSVTGLRKRNDSLKFEREKLLGALEQLVVWSEAFEALPPDDMKDVFPFSQYTTAGDCRQLKVALGQALAVLAEMKG